MFLPRGEYDMYGDWLLRQDADTLKNYFGITATTGFVRDLVDRVALSPGKHQFLIALDNNQWAGALHMAMNLNTDIEFGIIVAEQYRDSQTCKQRSIINKISRLIQRIYK